MKGALDIEKMALVEGPRCQFQRNLYGGHGFAQQTWLSSYMGIKILMYVFNAVMDKARKFM